MRLDATPFRVWCPSTTAPYLQERGIPSYPRRIQAGEPERAHPSRNRRLGRVGGTYYQLQSEPSRDNSRCRRPQDLRHIAEDVLQYRCRLAGGGIA